MSDRLLKESDVIEAFKGRESLIHDVYTATAIIRSVPSADRPQGEWIVYEGGWKDLDYYPPKCKCNQCGYEEDLYILNAKPTNYCPNCGARMKGADDE